MHLSPIFKRKHVNPIFEELNLTETEKKLFGESIRSTDLMIHDTHTQEHLSTTTVDSFVDDHAITFKWPQINTTYVGPW